MQSFVNAAVDRPLPVDEAYDFTAPFYDDWKWQRFWRKTEAPLVVDRLSQFARERAQKPDLLDVGCGTGWYLSRVKQAFAGMVGVDISAGMLAIARQRAPEAEFLQADILKLPFPDARFDAILCTRVLSHVADAGAAIAEMARLLRPGGLIIVSSVDADHDYEQTKLPLGDGHVFADTFKHSREEIAAHLSREGLSNEATLLITPEGKIRSLAGSGAAPPVGWLAAWRGPSHRLAAKPPA